MMPSRNGISIPKRRRAGMHFATAHSSGFSWGDFEMERFWGAYSYIQRRSIPHETGKSQLDHRVLAGKILLFAACLSVIVAYGASSMAAPANVPDVWERDHNYYHATNAAAGPGGKFSPFGTTGDLSGTSTRNLLVAQTSGPGPILDMTDATSRPNRAYAKQWRFDYLRFNALPPFGRLPRDVAFSKVYVLHRILEEKKTNSRAAAYDSIILLDADVVILDLDYTLLDFLPDRCLLAMAGLGKGEAGTVNSGVSLWNMNHPDVASVSKLWLEQSEQSLKAKTGEDDLQVLRRVLRDYNRDLAPDWICPIEVSMGGFLGGRAIKFSEPSSAALNRMDSLLADPQRTIATLQAVADSVCYRFFPRCEVL